MKCIYCNELIDPNERNQSSYEHIFPRALGGQTGRRHICCSDCNNELGNTVDAAVADMFKPFANMLDIVVDNRAGRAPALQGIETDEGEKIDLAPGGKPVFRPEKKVDVQRQEDGKTYIRIVARNEEEARYLLNHQIRRFELVREDLEDFQAFAHQRFNVTVPLEAHIDGLVRRGIAKVLLNVASLGLSPGQLRDGSFAPLAESVLGAEPPQGQDAKIIERFPPVEPAVEGDFVHVGVVWSNMDTHEVYGSLRLFGEIFFGMVMADDWAGPEFSIAISCDPLRGASAVHRPPNTITAERIVESSCDEERRWVAPQLNRLLANAGRRQRKVAQSNVIDEVMAEVVADMQDEDVEYFRREDFDRISRGVAERLTLMKYGGERREELDVGTIVEELKKEAEESD